jgi:hypothetical protein
MAGQHKKGDFLVEVPVNNFSKKLSTGSIPALPI